MAEMSSAGQGDTVSWLQDFPRFWNMSDKCDSEGKDTN